MAMTIIVATQVVKIKFLIDLRNGALHVVNTPYISVLKRMATAITVDIIENHDKSFYEKRML
jgi:hypothetical protein